MVVCNIVSPGTMDTTMSEVLLLYLRVLVSFVKATWARSVE